MVFCRPKLDYPQIYYTFQARDLHTNKQVNYRVQDFPRNRIDEGVQFMVQHFFEHEAMGKSRRIKSDRQAVKEISQFWRDKLLLDYSVACFRDNSDEFIAMNVLDVASLDDPKTVLKVNLPKAFVD